MADEVSAETADKPLADLATAERAIDPVKQLGPPPDFHENLPTTTAIRAADHEGANLATGPLSATDRLRAFEDEHFGKDAVRIGGKVERGSGSPFAAMSDEEKRQYAALEKLIAAEQKVADCRSALAQAEADHAAAIAAAETE